jgi:hypothetical protein
MPTLVPIHAMMAALWERLRTLHDDEDGYSTEAVVVTAALAALAIAAVAIIAAKVISQANAVQTH